MNPQILKEALKTLRGLKADLDKLNSLTKDTPEIKAEISQRRAKAYEEELISLAEENEGDVDALIGVDIDELVISEDDIFEHIIEERAGSILAQVNEVERKIRFNKDVDAIKVRLDGFKVTFEYRNFRSKDYDAVKKHYLKTENNRGRGRYNLGLKSYETYLRQREILAKLIRTSMPKATAEALKKYNFIDENLRGAINTLYSALVVGVDYGYCPLYMGEEINSKVEWFRKAVA